MTGRIFMVVFLFIVQPMYFDLSYGRSLSLLILISFFFPLLHCHCPSLASPHRLRRLQGPPSSSSPPLLYLLHPWSSSFSFAFTTTLPVGDGRVAESATTVSIAPAQIPLSTPSFRMEKSYASHLCVRIKFHVYDRLHEYTEHKVTIKK